MTSRDPRLDPEPPERSGGLLARMKRLFRVGPFGWTFRSLPPSRRYRPGEHMHGLERHDVEAREDQPLGGTGVRDVPVARRSEPPGR